jgi:hypothetical protein
MLEFRVRPLEVIRSIKRVLSDKGLHAALLVPSAACLDRGAIALDDQSIDYLRKSGVLGRLVGAGSSAADVLTAWHVGPDSLEEAVASLEFPELGGREQWLEVSDLRSFASSGDVLALFVLDGEIYVANASEPAVLEGATQASSPLGALLERLCAAKGGVVVDRFSEWNARLLSGFMSEAFAGEEVFLRVDPDVLDAIGQDLGGDAGFVAAVRAGPAWGRSSPYLGEQILSLVRQRQRVARLPLGELANPARIAAVARADGYVDPGELQPAYRGRAAPTYLPYLAMFVRVAASNSNDSFYRKLQELLGLSKPFGSANMATLECAWSDLEEWTRSRNGRFGLFKLRRLGVHQHLGVPQSQCILKASDAQRLPLVFKRAEISSDAAFGEDAVRRAMAEARAESDRSGTFLSASFAAALRKPEFATPISSILRAIHEDWDGTLPARGSRVNGDDTPSTSSPRVGLCLSLVQDEPLQFDIHWSVPPVHDAGNFELRHGGSAWAGTYSGADGGVTRVVGEDLQQAAWRIALESADGNLAFVVASHAEEDADETTETVTLAKHWLWILVPRLGGPHGRPWLQEGDLPGYGTAFLLAPPSNADRLLAYLEREQPDHERMAAGGVPTGWMLVRLNECSVLSDSQRTLPDGAEPHTAPRLIRFTGGRSVRRGFSSMYLPYDLPDVEFDAPPGAMLKFPDGLAGTLQAPVGHDGDAPSPLGHSVKRYGIRLLRPGSASYQITATLEGKAIGRPAVLRIASTDGDVVQGGDFSLDELGRPQAASRGLSGVLPEAATIELAGDNDNDNENNDDLLRLETQWLGVPIDGHGLAPGVEEKFLDELGQTDSGSMDIGVAQARVAKLLALAPRFDEPKLLIMELRSRGHLEVATTPKGHMSRVHAVQPTIFRLPVVCQGTMVYGVLGTLRLAHCARLASGIPGLRVFAERTRGRRFKALRLVEEVSGAMQEACAPDGALGLMGFRLATFPSLAISRWCEGLEAVRTAALRNPMESIGRAAETAVRFNAATGRFTAAPSGIPHELWRTKDLDTGFGAVHYLVRSDGDSGGRQYAFLRDSRWGAWIALESFVHYLKSRIGVDGVHPFPLTYEGPTRTVWLPARLGLPVALERTLALCAGSAPELFELEGAPDQNEPTTRLALGLADDAGPRVRASSVYHDMAKGKWLAYRWVPRDVANEVAIKLGARLDVV